MSVLPACTEELGETNSISVFSLQGLALLLLTTKPGHQGGKVGKYP